MSLATLPRRFGKILEKIRDRHERSGIAIQWNRWGLIKQEPLRCVLVQDINPSLVLVQPRKTRPFITERLLMGRKESNQTKQIISRVASSVIPLFHTGHESPESPRIDFLLIRGDS